MRGQRADDQPRCTDAPGLWQARGMATRGRPARDGLDLLRAATVLWDAEAQDVGYLARLFTQTSLPYRDPGDVPFWGRRNGDLSLTVQPGVVTEADGTSRSIGYPFGTVPRLLLTWLSTEAVRTKSRDLILGENLSDFMRQLGMQATGGRNGTIHRLRTQAERLFQASLSVRWDNEHGTGGGRMGIASTYQLWKAEDDPNQTTLFPSVVRLSGDFFDEVTQHPVPLDLGALRALRGSPMRLDIYCWLTYRMSYLHRRTEVPWTVLRTQFGSNLADTKQGRARFRVEFERHLREVVLVYREANVEVSPGGVVLLPSRTHVPPAVPRSPLHNV
jgi:Plasmid encoded RepA protein